MSRLYRTEAVGSTWVIEQLKVEVLLAQQRLARKGFRDLEAMKELQAAAQRAYNFAKAIGWSEVQRGA